MIQKYTDLHKQRERVEGGAGAAHGKRAVLQRDSAVQDTGMHVTRQETDQSWGGRPRGRSVVNLSVWGERNHIVSITQQLLQGDTQGPMAHAVPHGTPCRGVAGRGRGRRQADEFSGGTLGILT